MANRNLKNKPLNEAIIEVRWGNSGPIPASLDPNYKLLLGRFYERVLPEFPNHESLPTAALPDEMVANMVQHRFRHKDGWPLVQLGPGLMTYNETAKYDWKKNFRDGAVKSVNRLIDAYPADKLPVTSLTLRYIDLVEFDYGSASLSEFLEKLKISVKLPTKMFSQYGITENPEQFVLQTAFACGKPKGRLSLNVGTALKDDAKVVVWETAVETKGADLPKFPDDFETWATQAHDVANDLFFEMIEGELEARFA
jgi:uncharacterized protein (TIGR04255 family)